MATIKIRWTVSELENVMSQFDVERIYRSITGIDGVYSLLDTVALVEDQTSYYYDDLSGSNSYYYKLSHYNTVTHRESNTSTPISGSTPSHPALEIVSIDDLKNRYLFGVDLTDDSGTPYPDSMFEHYIRSAVSWLEHKLDVCIIPKVITEEKHDYYPEDFQSYLWMHLKEYPVISVESAKMVFPWGQNEVEFDNSWLHLQKESGQLQIVPGGGNINNLVYGSGLKYYPYMNQAIRHIPDLLRIAYTAGFETVPDVIVDLIGKIASFGPLNIAGDLIVGAGIANISLGIDGLSQGIGTTSSATNSGYGARLLIYRREIMDIIPGLVKYYKGLRLVVV